MTINNYNDRKKLRLVKFRVLDEENKEALVNCEVFFNIIGEMEDLKKELEELKEENEKLENALKVVLSKMSEV